MKVRLSISKGEAAIFVDGEHVGWATRTDAGSWWAGVKLPNGDCDIVADWPRRRDAVADVVAHTLEGTP